MREAGIKGGGMVTTAPLSRLVSQKRSGEIDMARD